MKKPVVDYRTFRLRKINEPQFSHLKLLLGCLTNATLRTSALHCIKMCSICQKYGIPCWGIPYFYCRDQDSNRR